MNREIKFRAWDKENKGMRFERDGEIGRLDLFFRRLYGMGVDIMQYTGLHDKNGKEIYEGDVFEVGYFGWKCVVEWDDENSRFLGFTIEGERKIVYIGRSPQPVTVIGNIYSNPELLQEAGK